MSVAYPVICRPLALAIAVAGLSAPPVQAQLEEVIVTAQKRAESVQDVPIAITAFDTAAMEARQILGAADLRYTAPNVSFSNSNFTSSNFQIRGVGTNLVAASADAGVGIHVNEVPVFSPRLFETEYYDVAQVSVLRGPQGTLYGRNSTGGAVNMETRTAHSDAVEGKLEGQYGNYDHKKVVAALNLPLTDRLAMRAAGLWLQRDGFTDNLYTGNDIDGRDQYSLRLSFNWTGENTSANLMLSYFDEDSTRSRSQKQLCKNDPSGLLGCLPDGLGFDKPNPSSQLSNILASDALLGPLGIFPFGSNSTSEEPRHMRKVNADFDPIYEADETLVILDIEHEMDKHTLALVAGYQDTTMFSRMDYTWNVGEPREVPPLLAALAPETYAYLFTEGLPLSEPSRNATGSVGGHISYTPQGLESFDQSNRYSEQYSIEARIQSDYDGRLNFLVGAFWMDVELDDQFWVIANGFDYVAAVAGSVGAEDGFGWVGPQFNTDTEEFAIDSRALFGELYYAFSDELKLTVGARYNVDTKDIRDRQILLNNDPDSGARLLQRYGADKPIPVDYRDDSEEWQEWTGRVVLDWAVSADTLAYASYSRGYKGGGFNPPFDPVDFPSQTATFDPEFVDAWEVGMKNTLLDNTLQANFSAFFYDYEGMQTSKIVNRTSFNENTDAEIYGLEAEFVFAPTASWLFNGSVSYLHTEVMGHRSIDPRDPTAGSDEVTLIKDTTTAVNCVVGLSPAEFAAADVGGQFNSCSALRDLGLPVSDGVLADLDGRQLLNSPEWSLSLGGQYSARLAGDYELSLRVDYYWQDEMYTRLYNREVDRIDDWDIWNAQANLLSPDNSWYLRAYVKNIADEDNFVGMYLSSASSGLFTNVFTIEPRTYGLAIGYNFQ
ncbi:TonB-dependent receptor [Seongchinamella sediminis]|uniref:TonB-dependent receptor n=1 Tax=Seongchinamella sediminis TaxID=2283635 RepID=A0A3L7E437_9GAMM|nr:TonB-dependent receptor [Seongchinamella sediminis]RLQ23600.1 TonB-dependent receptor [Seongchinamella sediminis]